MTHTIYEELTPTFVEQVKVSAVFIECKGKYLFLRKAAPAHLVGKWGVPGGKVDEGETIEEAAKRELQEEIGIDVPSHAIKYLKPLYITTEYASFGFYIFALTLDEFPEIKLSDEHDEYRWLEEEGVEQLDLMAGGLIPFKHVVKFLAHQKMTKAVISAYLILLDGDKVCLGLRQNTGYMDNYYGLISGHVEAGEAASVGMAREALEEAGIVIDPDTLKSAHIMHRTSPNRLNIDVFFSCTEFEGKIENKEPKKCGGWGFFPINNLPENTMDYVKQAILEYSKGNPYSEWGFTKISD